MSMHQFLLLFHLSSIKWLVKLNHNNIFQVKQVVNCSLSASKQKLEQTDETGTVDSAVLQQVSSLLLNCYNLFLSVFTLLGVEVIVSVKAIDKSYQWNVFFFFFSPDLILHIEQHLCMQTLHKNPGKYIVFKRNYCKTISISLTALAQETLFKLWQ